jgi:hypothetical protein
MPCTFGKMRFATPTCRSACSPNSRKAPGAPVNATSLSRRRPARARPAARCFDQGAVLFAPRSPAFAQQVYLLADGPFKPLASLPKLVTKAAELLLRHLPVLDVADGQQLGVQHRLQVEQRHCARQRRCAAPPWPGATRWTACAAADWSAALRRPGQRGRWRRGWACPPCQLRCSLAEVKAISTSPSCSR